jgi:hypothetical protein
VPHLLAVAHRRRIVLRATINPIVIVRIDRDVVELRDLEIRIQILEDAAAVVAAPQTAVAPDRSDARRA